MVVHYIQCTLEAGRRSEISSHAEDNTCEELHFLWGYVWEETVGSVEGAISGFTVCVRLAPAKCEVPNKESFLLPLHTRSL